MAIEIEVRFLVFALPGLPEIVPAQFRQGYLSTDPSRTVRVRQKNGKDGFLTIKGKKIGASAPEFEYPVPAVDLEELLKLCGELALTKDRYKVPGPDGQVWELDLFTGRHTGLMIAELEIAHETAPFTKPDWLGPEITTDKRFSNANLVQTDMAEIQKWVSEYSD